MLVKGTTGDDIAIDYTMHHVHSYCYLNTWRMIYNMSGNAFIHSDIVM